jgi:hypothetical protein
MPLTHLYLRYGRAKLIAIGGLLESGYVALPEVPLSERYQMELRAEAFNIYSMFRSILRKQFFGAGDCRGAETDHEVAEELGKTGATAFADIGTAINLSSSRVRSYRF